MNWVFKSILVFFLILVTLIDVHAKSSLGKLSQEVKSKYFVQSPELLISPEHSFKLRVNEQTKIDIPSEWLVPEKKFIEEKNNYVSSFNYLKEIEFFRVVGQRFIGVHLSSYESMPPGGSAMAASGRDVFLVLDTVTGELAPALITLGETKGRVRSSGCFFAKNSHFFICDINQDSYIDIGITREEISCGFDTIEENGIETDVVSGPNYRLYPRQWYTFDLRQHKWISDPSFGTRQCQNERKLKYIEIDNRSPVDDVIHVFSKGRVSGLNEYYEFRQDNTANKANARAR